MKTYTLHNFATGQTLKKTQTSYPTVKGFTVVGSERALPPVNAKGERLFREADRHYYAAETGDGSHRQP